MIANGQRLIGNDADGTDAVAVRVNSDGALRTVESAIKPGDLATGAPMFVQRACECIRLTADTQAITGPCLLLGYNVIASTEGTGKFWNGVGAVGAYLGEYTFTAGDKVDLHGVYFATGCYFDTTAGTQTIELFYAKL